MHSTKKNGNYQRIILKIQIQDLKVQNKALQDSLKSKEVELTKKEQAAIKMVEEVINKLLF